MASNLTRFLPVMFSPAMRPCSRAFSQCWMRFTPPKMRSGKSAMSPAAKLPAGVVNEHIVQCRVLDRERLDLHFGAHRKLHQFRGCLRTIAAEKSAHGHAPR